MQKDPQDQLQVISYFSKKLKPVETRYSTTDREAWSIVLACRQFHHYLWGTKVLIKTDQPLVSVFKQQTKSPRMNRWILEMHDYRCQIQYKSGKSNLVTDHLSRHVRIIRHQTEERWLGKTREELKQLQRAEPRWLEMTEYLEGGRIQRSKYPKATLDQFVLEGKILYFTREKIDHAVHYLLVVPSDLKQATINLIHNRESGHLGQEIYQQSRIILLA